MMSAPKHPQEAKRLEALERLKILDTLPEQDFDDLIQIAAQICGVPTALISLVDGTRQWFKAKVGIEVDETKREVAFCAHAILQDDIFVVPDASSDDRFKDNPLVTAESGIRFYAGAPISSPEGYPLGTICVIDTSPRQFPPDQAKALQALSRQVTRLLELKTQVTSLKQATRALDVQKKAIELMSDGFLLRDSQDKIVDFNPAAQQMLDMSDEEIAARHRSKEKWSFVRPDGSPLPQEERPSHLARQTGKIQIGKLMGIRRTNGQIVWINANCSPLFLDGATEPTHTITTFMDITAQINANRQVEAGERQLRKILEGLPAGVAYYLPDQTLLNANSTYAQINDKLSSEILGQKMAQVIGADLYSEIKNGVARVLKGEPQSFEKVSTRGGRLRSLLVQYFPDKTGSEIHGFLVFLTDVTEIKNLEHQRRQLEAKLVASSRLSALGEMAGGVAHEINTPLTIIQMTVDTLQTEVESGSVRTESVRKAVQRIETTVTRIAKIIKGLRVFARDSDNDPLSPARLTEIVDSTLALCREQLVTEKIDLRLQDLPDVTLMCRATQLSQVMMILINNSQDAMEALDEKWLEIRAEVTTGQILRLTVTDSGPGLAKEVADKLMQPFFTTKEVGRGTGLGLSIAKGILLDHKGNLWYDRSSKNTRFVMEIPISNASL